jgi:arabinan endo-1,5-alpha-L-arabinosidase
VSGPVTAGICLVFMTAALASGAGAVAPPGLARPPISPATSYPNPNPVSGDTRVHDPSMVRAPNGSYILVHTGANLAIKTSADRVAWRDAGVVWPNGAPWTTAYTGGSSVLWAPDISFQDGQFVLYYAASSFGSQNSAIFLATSPTGLSGSWTDRGLVIASSSAVNYNAIDPNLVVDPRGQRWLTLGSFWTGIKMVHLDPSTGKPSASDPTVRPLAQRPAPPDAIEASFVFQHGAMWYLFVSFDLCCRGAQSTYRIMVGRSASVTGPYVDRGGVAMTAGGGTQLLAGHGSIHGPGGQSVLADRDGAVLVYHYYADNGTALLGINHLGWDAAGWPIVL